MLRALASALILAASPLQASPLPPSPVLRVGVADGSQPCSYRQQGSWTGMAVELWQRVADRERLPYVLVPSETAAELLEATRRGAIDVAIGCLTVSPERLRTTRFSLPFQESGLSVMTRRNQLELGLALLRSLLAPDLLRLLLATVLLTGLLSAALWWVEGHGRQPASGEVRPRRSFALIFQVLATGPGTNTVVVTTRGQLLVFLAYLVRITSASLLVSYVTLNVVRGSPTSPTPRLRELRDLAGWRVAVRHGSVSDDLLRSLNRGGLRPPIQLRELERVPDADRLLANSTVEAVMADAIQLDSLLAQLPHQRYGLALRDLHPQSQAFALAPGLDDDTARRIDHTLGLLKRDGVVARLRRQAITNP